MKRISFILAFFLCFTAFETFAQFELTRETYKINVKNFPKYYVEPSNMTYCFKIQQNGVKNCFADDYFRTELDFPEGWSEIDNETDAFMAVTFSVSPISIVTCDLKNKRTEKIDSAGDLNVMNHFFPSIKYTFSMKCVFKCKYETFEWTPFNRPGGAPAASNVYDVKIDFPTREEAMEYIEQSKIPIQTSIVSSALKDLAVDIPKLFAERFSDYDGSEYIPIQYLLADKCPYKTDMQSIRQGIKADMNKITVSDPVLSTSPNIERWIERFQMVAADMDVNKPDQKKAKEAMVKNLAYLFYIIEDFETAMRYANVLRDTFKSGDAPRIMRMIKMVQDKLEKYGKSSRHY